MSGRRYYRTSEAARLIGVSQRTVQRLVKAGILPIFRRYDDGWYQLHRDPVERYAVSRSCETSRSTEH